MLHKATDKYANWENAAFSDMRKRRNQNVKAQLCTTALNHLRAAKIKPCKYSILVFNTKTTQHANTVTPKLE